jgi:hypothetical protein
VKQKECKNGTKVFLVGKPAELAAALLVMDLTWARVKQSFYCLITMFKMHVLNSLTVKKWVETALLVCPR